MIFIVSLSESTFSGMILKSILYIPISNFHIDGQQHKTCKVAVSTCQMSDHMYRVTSTCSVPSYWYYNRLSCWHLQPIRTKPQVTWSPISQSETSWDQHPPPTWQQTLLEPANGWVFSNKKCYFVVGIIVELVLCWSWRGCVEPHYILYFNNPPGR